jgi:hypothetical protein
LVAANLASLVSSAALGEALVFLATNSLVELTDRRVILMRELSRLEVRRALGMDDDQSCAIPRRLRAGEPLRVLAELRRAAEFGTTSAMHRFRVGGGIAEGRSNLPAISGMTVPAA